MACGVVIEYEWCVFWVLRFKNGFVYRNLKCGLPNESTAEIYAAQLDEGFRRRWKREP